MILHLHSPFLCKCLNSQIHEIKILLCNIQFKKPSFSTSRLRIVLCPRIVNNLIYRLTVYYSQKKRRLLLNVVNHHGESSKSTFIVFKL